MASFSTVSLMRETEEIISRFARYYLEAGAVEVLVFYDGPAPSTPALPGMVLIECDEAFWSGRGGRPEALEERQSAIYHVGMERCRSDWLLVVDADEYVFGNRTIPAFLDAVPQAVDVIRVPTAEAVWGPGDDLDAPFGSTYFRTLWRSDRLWRALKGLIYGDAAAYMRRGLIGHTHGKQFLRAGKPYSAIRNIATERDGKVITRPAAEVAPSLAGMFLGHFDAIGLARWTAKWRQRIEKETIAVNMEQARTSQMDLVADRMQRGDGALRALFAQFYGLTKAQYAVLSLLGCAFRRDIFSPDR